jgi:hypothetical protein
MSTPPAGSPAAIPSGWYADYADPSQVRWWDGTRWTEHVAPAMGATIATGPPTLTPYGIEASTAPPGTRTGTVWIWLVVLLPLLSVVGLFTVDWAEVTREAIRSSLASPGDPSTGPDGRFAAYTSPGSLISSILGWVIYALSVLFAALDRRELIRRGVPRPFHWAWTFLLTAVYVIGRSVVVRRRTGGGLAPLWAWIGTVVISIGASIWVTAQIVAVVGEYVGNY